jgi:hypothetical protein
MEGFGLPAVEAAAAGAPMVVSEDPALSAAAPPSAVRAASWDVDSWVAAVDAVAAGVAGPGADAWDDGAPRSQSHVVRRWTDVAEETISAIRSSDHR